MKSTAQGYSETAKPNSSEKFWGWSVGRLWGVEQTFPHISSMKKSLACLMDAWTVPPGGIIFSGHLNLSCLVADTFNYN